MNLLRKISFVLLSVFAASGMQAGNDNYTQYVNPMVGSGGHGHVFVGASVPFGFVQAGPSQYTQGWDWCSGYHYSDSILVGFAQQHLSGTGIGDLGDVVLLPVSNVNQKDVKFSHANETVKAGYYAVKLNNPNVFVEITASKRVAYYRYTYGGDNKETLMKINLKQGIGWDKMTSCQLKQEDKNTFSGYRKSSGWAKNQQVYFVMKFSCAADIVNNQNDSIFTLGLSASGQPVDIEIALSPVSVENAKENLKKESYAPNFAQAVKAADKAWNEQLGKISVNTDNETTKRIFYTALYHSMIAPSVFNDVNGEYFGSDGKTHKGNFTNYTTLSLWDTYRAAHPLMTIIHPEIQKDMAATFINIYREQGKLPVWHLMGNETDCMVGNPGIPVLADLVLKGYVTDREAAYEALKASAMKDDRGMNLLKKYGYLPWNLDPTFETVAKGLEYALADASVAKVAKLLGKTEDYKYFYNRSMSYAKYFDKKSGFMRGVSDKGEFREPFSPFHAVHRQDDYTEGNAWQYTWLVPHDVHGLVKLFGGEKPFVEKFDSLFIVEGDLGEDASPDISGLIGQYAHGNEPSHHILYMYNYVGQPWKGAKLLRQTMKEMYHDAFDGLSGNEDVGQMSAWYILSSLGLYQVEPSGGKYIIGTPLFTDAKINVGGGKTFTIVANGNSDENIYVQSARLNGKPYTKSYIMFTDIMKGGKLELVMGNKPSKFGTDKKDRP